MSQEIFFCIFYKNKNNNDLFIVDYLQHITLRTYFLVSDFFRFDFHSIFTIYSDLSAIFKAYWYNIIL